MIAETRSYIFRWRSRCRRRRLCLSSLLPRQRHRQKTTIWLVEWGKLTMLHVRHALGAFFFLPSLSNDDVKFSNLRFWRQRKPAALNLSLPFLEDRSCHWIKGKDTFTWFHMRFLQSDQHGIIAKKLNPPQIPILKRRFRRSLLTTRSLRSFDAWDWLGLAFTFLAL